MTDPEAVENGPRTNSMAPTKQRPTAWNGEGCDEDAETPHRSASRHRGHRRGRAGQAEKAESDAARARPGRGDQRPALTVAQLLEFAAIPAPSRPRRSWPRNYR